MHVPSTLPPPRPANMKLHNMQKKKNLVTVSTVGQEEARQTSGWRSGSKNESAPKTISATENARATRRDEEGQERLTGRSAQRNSTRPTSGRTSQCSSRRALQAPLCRHWHCSWWTALDEDGRTVDSCQCSRQSDKPGKSSCRIERSINRKLVPRSIPSAKY